MDDEGVEEQNRASELKQRQAGRPDEEEDR